LKGKSRRTIAKVAQDYLTEIERLYPSAEPEIMDKPIGGFEVWIRIELPPELDEDWLKVDRIISELSYRFWDETGINVVATTAPRETVPA
jgi:hypothetical protein